VAKPIRDIYKDYQRVKEGKLFKSSGRAGKIKTESPRSALRVRSVAEAASMDIRLAKSIQGETSPSAKVARLRQKAALRGLNISRENMEKRLAKPAARVIPGSMDLGRLARLARGLGKIGGKLGAIGLVPLPSQLEEYKELKKPLHKKEQERAARRM